MFTIVRSCRVSVVLVALLSSERAALAAGQSIGECAWTDAIPIAPELRAEVEHMLRASATFRSQGRRIAQAQSIIIGVRVDPTLSEGSFKARSTFRHYR